MLPSFSLSTTATEDDINSKLRQVMLLDNEWFKKGRLISTELSDFLPP